MHELGGKADIVLGFQDTRQMRLVRRYGRKQQFDFWANGLLTLI